MEMKREKRIIYKIEIFRSGFHRNTEFFPSVKTIMKMIIIITMHQIE